MSESKSYPISMLPDFTQVIQGMLCSTTKQLEIVKQMANESKTLQVDTMDSIIQLYTKQLNYCLELKEQFDHWKQSQSSIELKTEIEQLVSELPKIKGMNEEIIKLVQSMKYATQN